MAGGVWISVDSGFCGGGMAGDREYSRENAITGETLTVLAFGETGGRHDEAGGAMKRWVWVGFIALRGVTLR